MGQAQTSSDSQERHWLAVDRYKAILDQMPDIIFEWDIKKDIFSVSSNWYKKFGYIPSKEEISKKLFTSEYIFKEDIAAVKRLIEDIKAGVSYSEIELRIRNMDGKIIFCRIRMTNTYDRDRMAERAIGIISDIGREKHQRQFLIEKSRRDSLTGLLHKRAAKKAVEEYLDNTDAACGIMMILDLDDFKQVNDQYGHLCGDTLITDVALILRKSFQSGDIISRVGGDEFLVFLPGTAKTRMEDCISVLKKNLAQLDVSGEMGVVSCSIGIACLPENAVDFNSLYRCADLALYQVKCKEKGAVADYRPEMERRGFKGRLSRKENSQMSVSGGLTVSDLLGQYSFQMLYEASDIAYAVNKLLETVGVAYDVSRVYIFENLKDAKGGSNTFEWCNTGVTPLMEKMKIIPYENETEKYRSYFDEDDIFYCSDVRRLEPLRRSYFMKREACSVLQCAVRDGGKFCGFVGFDECISNRRWTRDQIEALTLVSRVISVFLLNYRMKNKILQTETMKKDKKA